MSEDCALSNNTPTTSLISDLKQIVDQCRNRVALNVNAELTMMYWHIGERINRDVLGNQRAEYGKQIVASVSRQLQEEYLTELPSREVLKQQIQKSLAAARERHDFFIEDE